MRSLWENRFVRGLALVAIVSAAIVALSLENALITAGALMRIAFFLAIAFFLFLLWRERRSDIEAWSDLSRRTFYAAIALAVASEFSSESSTIASETRATSASPRRNRFSQSPLTRCPS